MIFKGFEMYLMKLCRSYYGVDDGSGGPLLRERAHSWMSEGRIAFVGTIVILIR